MSVWRLVLTACCVLLLSCGSDQPSTLESIATALIVPSIPAPTASAKPPARMKSTRPRFDAKAWFAAEGLDPNKAFEVYAVDPDRLMRHFNNNCRPLSLRTVNVLVCDGAGFPGNNPMIVRVSTTKIQYVRDGRLRTAKEFASGTIPDEMPDSPLIGLRCRADGDALVIEDDRFDSCVSDMRTLHATQKRRPEARRALILVAKVCSNIGRYHWAGARFVRASTR